MTLQPGSVAKIIGGNGNRKPLDFYPTPPEVTHALMLWMQANGILPASVYEPACGNGAMVNVVRQYTDCVGTDIQMGTDYRLADAPAGITAVITNPPFSLAEAFIRKALTEAPTVAMLTKSTFWHAQSRADLFTRKPPAYILALLWRPDFDGKNSPMMECIWTVWLQGIQETRYQVLSKPKASVR